MRALLTLALAYLAVAALDYSFTTSSLERSLGGLRLSRKARLIAAQQALAWPIHWIAAFKGFMKNPGEDRG